MEISLSDKMTLLILSEDLESHQNMKSPVCFTIWIRIRMERLVLKILRKVLKEIMVSRDTRISLTQYLLRSMIFWLISRTEKVARKEVYKSRRGNYITFF